MDFRNVVVIKDDDTTINLLDSDEEKNMSEKGEIPFLDLDPSPSPPKRSRDDDTRSVVMKSKIQRAPEAEDGEIVSSPEMNAADLEIQIHAEMTSSGESENEKDIENENDEEEMKVDNVETEDVQENVSQDEVIILVDTPEKQEKKPVTPVEEFPQKKPVHVQRLGAVMAKEDDEIEIDHLDIVAPLQMEAKKSKLKSRDQSKTNSPGKYASPEKEKLKRSRSPREDTNKKRGYDVFDERRTSRSDTEIDDKHRRSEKRPGNELNDLRKHLLKKHASSERNARESEKMKEHRDRGRENQERSKDREKQRSSGRDNRERNNRERDDNERQERSKTKETATNKDLNYEPDHKRKLTKEDSKRDSSHEDSYKKDKSRSRKSDEKSKKKKKRRHRDEQQRKERDVTPIIESPENISLEKSPVSEKEENKSELPYDDITSGDSARSVHSSPASPIESPVASRSPSPIMSVSRTPSRSPTPVRSPTPQRKRTYFPAIEGCRNVEEFTWLNRIEEGTYGVVYRAKDKRSEEVVALKRLKMEKEREGFPITSLREINTLLKSQHPNIVTVREIVVGSNMDKIYIVMDYVEHDLKSLMETMSQPFLVGEVKTLMIQLLRGVRHMHDNWILHRDIKASNLLLSHKGILKIGDFGLAREYGSPLKKYTSVVVTLWYRAPELLLGAKEYSTAIDLWSVGCVFAELLTMKPLFPGRSEIDQINRIFKELGTPNDKIWPGPPAYSELPQVKKMNIAQHPYNILRQRFGATLTDYGFDFMNKLLTYDPARRMTAEEGLKAGYFKESPLPVDPSMFPTWPAKSEMGHRAMKKKNASPKAPEGGGEFNLQGDDGLGFHMPTTHKGSAAKGLGFALKF